MDTPVSGTPKLLLRLEGAAVLFASLVAYGALGASWPMFALLLLAPDLTLLGYLGGPRAGAHVYNAGHSYIGPALLAAAAHLQLAGGAWPLCLIWTAHIGMDRTLGYGLKFTAAFGETHLGPVGRGLRERASQPT
jgi:hypothetical protein